MGTKNLNLPEMDGSDYISVDVFNDAFSKLDKLGIDYVVESGKVGEWWYRKWKSGRAECGIDAKEFPRQEMTLTYGSSLYRTPAVSIGNYPIQFKAKPNCVVNFIEDKAYGTGRGALVANLGDGTTSKGPSVFMVDPTSKTAQLVFGVYVTGWYK